MTWWSWISLFHAKHDMLCRSHSCCAQNLRNTSSPTTQRPSHCCLLYLVQIHYHAQTMQRQILLWEKNLPISRTWSSFSTGNDWSTQIWSIHKPIPSILGTMSSWFDWCLILNVFQHFKKAARQSAAWWRVFLHRKIPGESTDCIIVRSCSMTIQPEKSFMYREGFSRGSCLRTLMGECPSFGYRIPWSCEEYHDNHAHMQRTMQWCENGWWGNQGRKRISKLT